MTMSYPRIITQNINEFRQSLLIQAGGIACIVELGNGEAMLYKRSSIEEICEDILSEYHTKNTVYYISDDSSNANTRITKDTLIGHPETNDAKWYWFVDEETTRIALTILKTWVSDLSETCRECSLDSGMHRSGCPMNDLIESD